MQHHNAAHRRAAAIVQTAPCLSNKTKLKPTSYPANPSGSLHQVYPAEKRNEINTSEPVVDRRSGTTPPIRQHHCGGHAIPFMQKSTALSILLPIHQPRRLPTEFPINYWLIYSKQKVETRTRSPKQYTAISPFSGIRQYFGCLR